MLRTRLVVGAILIVLTVGMLYFDLFVLHPFYPFLFVFVVGLSAAACLEAVRLLGSQRAPQPPLVFAGAVGLAVANWPVNHPNCPFGPWQALAGIFAGLVLAVFIYEMARFTGPGRSVERMALTVWLVAYLGLLPCFFAQIRWLYPPTESTAGSAGLALAIFVPKMCDTGAYFTGRLVGRTKMTPVLSPKKTWEGAAGGLTAAALTAIAIDRLGPEPVLRGDLINEIAFGLSVGLAGMLGDLAESLVKRDCQRKDASDVVPGFGGVLDVVDAVVFSAPVSYAWLALLSS